MSKKKNRRKRKNKSKSNLYKGPGSKGRAETPDGKPVRPEPQFTKGMRKVAQTVFNRLLPPLRETTEVLEMIAEEGGKSAKDAEAFAGILKDFNHRIENHMIANGMAQPAGNARPQPVQQESTEESAADKPKRTITPVDGSDDDEWECWVEAGDEQTLAGIADSLEDARAWVKGDDSVLDEEEGDEDDPDPDEDGADEAEEPAEKTQEAKSKAKPKKK